MQIPLKWTWKHASQNGSQDLTWMDHHSKKRKYYEMLTRESWGHLKSRGLLIVSALWKQSCWLTSARMLTYFPTTFGLITGSVSPVWNAWEQKCFKFQNFFRLWNISTEFTSWATLIQKPEIQKASKSKTLWASPQCSKFRILEHLNFRSLVSGQSTCQCKRRACIRYSN